MVEKSIRYIKSFSVLFERLCMKEKSASGCHVYSFKLGWMKTNHSYIKYISWYISIIRDYLPIICMKPNLLLKYSPSRSSSVSHEIPPMKSFPRSDTDSIFCSCNNQTQSQWISSENRNWVIWLLIVGKEEETRGRRRDTEMKRRRTREKQKRKRKKRNFFFRNLGFVTRVLKTPL